LSKEFNVEGLCLPEQHYMVSIGKQLEEIKALVDKGKYFTINRARQYGKTTTLHALKHKLDREYYVFSISFEGIEEEVFANADSFCIRLFGLLYDTIAFDEVTGVPAEIKEKLHELSLGNSSKSDFRTMTLMISYMCKKMNKPLALIIDEIDQASNYRVFDTFLGCLRDMYLKRGKRPTFQSVILAGVYDINNLKAKIRSDKEHTTNSPWNIAADFTVDMSLSEDGIRGMLREYEEDYLTGMDIPYMASLIFEYTSGYPYLVSKICKLLDERVTGSEGYPNKAAA